MKFWFLGISAMLFSLPELWSGMFGIVLPLTLVPVYFAAAAYGWFTGALCAVGTGIWMDMIYCREFPVSVPAFAVTVLAVWLIRRDREIQEWTDALPSAAVSAAAAEAVWSISECLPCKFTVVQLQETMCHFIWNSALGALLVFAGFGLLAFFSEKLGIPMLKTMPVSPAAGNRRRKRRWSPDGNLK